MAGHDGDACIGPCEEEARSVGPAAHSVVPCTERTPDERRDLWDARSCDCGNEFGAVLGDALRLVPPTDHEARYVLQEEERNVTLAGELDEVRALQRTLREQDTVVRQDADGHAP